MNTINIADLASDYAVSATDIREALGLYGFQADIAEVTEEREAEIHETLAAKFL